MVLIKAFFAVIIIGVLGVSTQLLWKHINGL